MKEIFIYIDDEGYFTCNTGITVDMWKTFLRDGKLMTPDRIDMLVKFYNEPVWGTERSVNESVG